MTLGQKLKKARLDRGLTQAQVVGCLLYTSPPPRVPRTRGGFLRSEKAPLPGADSTYQGEMSRRDKRGRDAVCEAD